MKHEGMQFEENEMKLSPEALSLSMEKVKKLDEIREKVQNDFYFRPEVKERVIEGLLKDFKNLLVQ